MRRVSGAGYMRVGRSSMTTLNLQEETGVRSSADLLCELGWSNGKAARGWRTHGDDLWEAQQNEF